MKSTQLLHQKEKQDNEVAFLAIVTSSFMIEIDERLCVDPNIAPMIVINYSASNPMCNSHICGFLATQILRELTCNSLYGFCCYLMS
jgi:hypothetical protein